MAMLLSLFLPGFLYFSPMFTIFSHFFSMFPSFGWFAMKNPIHKWMMTGGSPISGNLHSPFFMGKSWAKYARVPRGYVDQLEAIGGATKMSLLKRRRRNRQQAKWMEWAWLIIGICDIVSIYIYILHLQYNVCIYVYIYIYDAMYIYRYVIMYSVHEYL